MRSSKMAATAHCPQRIVRRATRSSGRRRGTGSRTSFASFDPRLKVVMVSQCEYCPTDVTRKRPSPSRTTLPANRKGLSAFFARG